MVAEWNGVSGLAGWGCQRGEIKYDSGKCNNVPLGYTGGQFLGLLEWNYKGRKKVGERDRFMIVLSLFWSLFPCKRCSSRRHAPIGKDKHWPAIEGAAVLQGCGFLRESHSFHPGALKCDHLVTHGSRSHTDEALREKSGQSVTAITPPPLLYCCFLSAPS